MKFAKFFLFSKNLRNLGSIYEGLLEYKLKVADKDYIVSRRKGKEVFVPLKETEQEEKVRSKEIIRKEDVYLITDKGERKATGSYYTPQYVVEYIVKNTLVPVVEEKKKEAEKIIKEKKRRQKSLKARLRRYKGIRGESEKVRGYKKSYNKSIQNTKKEIEEIEEEITEGHILADQIYKIRVLDPAMGSGHFLVEATDFLARALIEALGESPEEEEEIKWARREIIERCIFGVDINPLAVELAKLSLWLYTVAKNKPLNFLDHHLRCGNSLIGVKVEDLKSLPKIGKKFGKSISLTLFEDAFKQDVNNLLNAFSQIENLPSKEVSDTRKKKKLYQKFQDSISKFRDVADVWVSCYFGDGIKESDYQLLQESLRKLKEERAKLEKEDWFKQAKDIAKDKKFFHWELEFPEIFYEGHREKENPGFDVVIGNPPYVDSENMVKNMPDERKYIIKHFKTTKGNWDLYIPFWEKSIALVNSNGNTSLITPNKWLSVKYGETLREFVKGRIYMLGDFSRMRVFEDSGIFPIVAFMSNSFKEQLHIQIFSHGYAIVHDYEVPKRIIEKFENWGIVLSKSPVLIEKTITNSIDFLDIVAIEEAFTVSEAYKLSDFIHELQSPEKNYFRFIITGTIDRYVSLWGVKETKYIKRKYKKPVVSKDILKSHFPRRYKQAISEKIIISGIRYFESFLDKNGNFLAGKSTVIIRDVQKNYTLEFVLTILNSKLTTFYLRESYGTLAMDGGINFTAPLVSKLPIPKIDFSMRDDRRLNELKDKYLSNESNENILFIVKPLPSNSAVLHDFLSFLAEQMLELNKKKQEEMRRFLGWLESEIGKEINSLQGKSKIKNFLGDYQKSKEFLEFKELVNILKKNRIKRLPKELESQYNESLSKLLLIKRNLELTDKLIDQIVYKLYGLTEKEIKIVEESIKR